MPPKLAAATVLGDFGSKTLSKMDSTNVQPKKSTRKSATQKCCCNGAICGGAGSKPKPEKRGGRARRENQTGDSCSCSDCVGGGGDDSCSCSDCEPKTRRRGNAQRGRKKREYTRDTSCSCSDCASDSTCSCSDCDQDRGRQKKSSRKTKTQRRRR